MKYLLAGTRPRFEVLPALPCPTRPRPASVQASPRFLPALPQGRPSSGLGAMRDPGGCWQWRRRRLVAAGSGSGPRARSQRVRRQNPAAMSPPTRSDSPEGEHPARASASQQVSRGGLGLSGEGRGLGEQRQEAGTPFPAPTQLGPSGALMGRGRGGKPRGQEKR